MTESAKDPRALWRTVKGLQHPGRSLSNHEPGLCNTFATSFMSKIAKVKSTVSEMTMQRTVTMSGPQAVDAAPLDVLNHLMPTAVGEVSRLIARLPSKTSPLDDLHTTVLKACSDVFAPLIVHLANLSFQKDSFQANTR